jgi:hypothetical protein
VETNHPQPDSKSTAENQSAQALEQNLAASASLRVLERIAQTPEGDFAVAMIAALASMLHQCGEFITHQTGCIESERSFLRWAKGRRFTLAGHIKRFSEGRSLAPLTRWGSLRYCSDTLAEWDRWTAESRSNLATYRAEVKAIRQQQRDAWRLVHWPSLCGTRINACLRTQTW